MLEQNVDLKPQPVPPSVGQPACDAVVEGKNSVAMSLIAAGLEFKLDTTVDQNADVLQLSAKLDLALTMLSISEGRLAEAFIKIGQLQERLRLAEAGIG